jgi:hypothetical protein
MPRFYCPGCWNDFPQDLAECPVCGLEIREFWDSKDFIEKLIVSLRHPEKETPIRAAWLLGKLKDGRAVDPLIALVRANRDVYISRAAISALGEMDSPAAREFLGSLTNHSEKVIRDQVRGILTGTENRSGIAFVT